MIKPKPFMASFSTILFMGYIGAYSRPRLQNHRQGLKLRFSAPELLEYPILSAAAVGFTVRTGPG